MISPIFISLRPKQWLKNLLIFIPLLLSEKGLLYSWQACLHTFVGFLTFCGLSGSVYILNDLVDISKDRLHPVKCMRPIASSLLSVKEAKAAFLLTLIISLFAAWKISELFFGVALVYFMLNLAYSFKLKKAILLDIMCIAAGFVLRIVAGIGALNNFDANYGVSQAFVITAFVFAMFWALTVKHQELKSIEDDVYEESDGIAYSVDITEKLLYVMSAVTISSYIFYTLSFDTTLKLGNNYLTYTIPFVIYGIIRYLLIVITDEDGKNISELIIKDKPLILCCFLWIISILFIIHFVKLLVICS